MDFDDLLDGVDLIEDSSQESLTETAANMSFVDLIDTGQNVGHQSTAESSQSSQWSCCTFGDQAVSDGIPINSINRAEPATAASTPKFAISNPRSQALLT